MLHSGQSQLFHPNVDSPFGPSEQPLGRPQGSRHVASSLPQKEEPPQPRCPSPLPVPGSGKPPQLLLGQTWGSCWWEDRESLSCRASSFQHPLTLHQPHAHLSGLFPLFSIMVSARPPFTHFPGRSNQAWTQPVDYCRTPLRWLCITKTHLFSINHTSLILLSPNIIITWDRQNRKAKQAGDTAVGTLTAAAVNGSGGMLHPILTHHVLVLVSALPVPALSLSNMLKDRSLMFTV